jgi:hypothetical protein
MTDALRCEPSFVEGGRILLESPERALYLRLGRIAKFK